MTLIDVYQRRSKLDEIEIDWIYFEIIFGSKIVFDEAFYDYLFHYFGIGIDIIEDWDCIMG